MSPLTSTVLVTPATIIRPDYLVGRNEPGFATKLTRITGDVGSPIAGLAPEDWDLDARHGYSKRCPWNCDGTLAYVEQRGGSPSKMILDAKTWKVLKGNTGNFRGCTEVRWHPTKPTWMVGYNKNIREVLIFDALSDALIKRISVPFVWQSSNGGFMGEGNLSLDGSIVAFGDEANNVCLIDLLSGRVSEMQKITFARVTTTGLDNITVSPLSTPARGYVVAHGDDFVRVFEYGSDLQLVPRFESPLKLSHADVGVTPDGREVFVGGARANFGANFSKDNGNVAAIFLDSGEIRNISAGLKQLGSKEAADQHCSCRGPKGWVLVTYAGPQETSGRFLMELVAYKLDGSRECVRFGVTRTNEKLGSNPYRNEAHGVMRPDGKAVMFASNFQHAASPIGNPSDVKSFVYELTDVVTPPIDPVPGERFIIDMTRNYGPGVVMDTATKTPVMLDELKRWGNERKP